MKEIEMIHKGQNKQTHNKVYDLLSKPSVEASDNPNLKRKLFLKMLKTRYGYTNDKAVDELQRLLTQFYRTNKSLGIHHP